MAINTKNTVKTDKTLRCVRAAALLLAVLLTVCACSVKPPREVPTAEPQTASPTETASVDVSEPAAAPSTAAPIAQTGYTNPVPQSYTEESAHPGSIVTLSYDSKDYLRGDAPIIKTAQIYLPYSYDENSEERYDVLYLMHGWTGNEGEFFTVLGGKIKRLLDNMIDGGSIAPLIVVGAAFYNENSDTGFYESVDELCVFHCDFRENLMPAVESRFRTYATSVSEEDLIASRDHRAFGGFSMGSATTWNEFCYDSEFIRWYLPMSGGCICFGGWDDYDTQRTCDYFEQLIAEKSLDERGFFIYSATGTEDWLKYQVDDLMNEMLKRPSVFTPVHLAYYLKQGGVHNHDAVMEYMYNALPLFFRGDN
ncbi:MAG: glycoside hydrolase [Clostridia bacterium]|nr:glycoside hydrolase [Clostridia bacterium]